MNRTCKTCGETFLDPDAMKKMNEHKRTVHGWVKTGGRNQFTGPVKPKDGIALLTELQKQTRSAVELMETERDTLHQRLIEMDNTIARYKKLLLTQ